MKGTREKRNESREEKVGGRGKNDSLREIREKDWKGERRAIGERRVT